MKKLQGKHVVITGAANGIGRFLAIDLAKEGCSVALIDINETNLKNTWEEVNKYEVQSSTYVCDLTNSEQVAQVAQRIKRDFKRVDILINNAGVVFGNWCWEAEYEKIKKTLDTNLLGAIWLTRQFLPEMVESNKGHIVNVSSAMGFQAVPLMSDYVATKFGLIGYSDTLRMELKKNKLSGIKVTIICPSGIATQMFKGYVAPRFSPILEASDVSRRIISAIKKEKAYLKIPFIVKTIPFLKFLPVGLTDKIAEALGLFKSMDNLH